MIELSDKFQLDISSNTYSIQPLIVIDADNNPIYISTYRQSFNIDEENSVYWEDYDLNISNITESIDLKTKNFKTGKLNFSLTNYKVNEKRISDDIAQYSLINKYVDIYYKTQSCKNLNDCSLVYRGIIKSVKHDSKKIKIVLEDLTEDKLNIEVPFANLGYTDKVFNDKYLNKEIPITYGEAFKAPAVLYLNGEGSDSLFAITDDIFNDRNINLGGWSGTEPRARQFTFATNSLYLYKEEYFQVFQQFKHKALGNNDSGEWDWTAEDGDKQYHYSGDAVKIPRYFSEGLPSNPPAFNELQTFIIRNPIQMLFAANDPNNTINAFYLQEDVLQIQTPALAIDNPDYIFLSSNYNVEAGYGTNPYETFAACPPIGDTAIEPEFGDALIVNNFYAHKFDELDSSDDTIGCWLPRRSGDVSTAHGHQADEWDTYQFKVFQYLNFNMDRINRDDQGIASGSTNTYKVQYVQMPSLADIRARLNSAFILYEYNTFTSSQKQQIADWHAAGAIDSECPYTILQTNDMFDQNSTQAYPQMCTAFRDHWDDLCNDTIDWGSYDGDGDGGFAKSNGGTRYYPQPTVFRFMPNSFWYGNLSQWSGVWYSNICVTQQTPQMTGNGYPTNQHYESNHLEYTWMNNYDLPSAASQYQGGAGFWNLFYDSNYTDVYNSTAQQGLGSLPISTLEGGAEPYWNFLFHKSELPTYTPIDRTSRFRQTNANSENWGAAVGYRCIWNGKEPNSMAGHQGGGVSYGHNEHKFFGVYGDNLTGYGCWVGDDNHEPNIGTHPIRDKDMYPTGNGDACWAIYVNRELQGTPEEALQGDDYDEDFKTVFDSRPNLIIPKGTILPCRHKTNTRGGGEWGNNDMADFGSTGNSEYTSDYIKIYDNDGDEEVDNRFGFAFQLDDIDESDVIKCDTFFTGKIHCLFDDGGTTNSTSARFELVLKTASIEDEGQDTDVVFVGNKLIDIDLDSVYAGRGETHIWSVAEQDQPYNSDFVNHYSSGEVNWISENNWDEPNSFNGFGLHYLLNNSSQGEDSAKAFVATEIYDAGILQVIQFENAFDSDLYISKAGRVNNEEDIIENGQGSFLKYTGDSVDVGEPVIKSPQDILYHFVEKELNMEDLIDEESLSVARGENGHLKYAFSINQRIKAKNFINDFVKSTNLSPTFKSTSKFGFSTIKNVYEDHDVNMTIKSEDILSYSFSRTPINDIKTIVNVKYAYDYAKDKYSRETGYVDGYDLFGNGDLGYRESGYSYDYLRLDREDNVLEFESKYIRDEETALYFRNYIYLWNCNQHNIFELKLPNKYINLEAGDIIRFDKLIEDVKAYGEDYTEEWVIRNSQRIYPYFFIHYISKKTDGINIKCTQLHELQRTFVPSLGSVTRNSNIQTDESEFVIQEDVDELVSFLNGSNKYFTRDQRRVSDLNVDGYITEEGANSDLILLQAMVSSRQFIAGDLNLDGAVNIHDLVTLISSILGDYELDLESLDIADLNNDGVINVVDVVALMNQILGENNV